MNNTDWERTPSRGLCLLTAASGLELLYCGLLLDGSISAFFPLGDMEATVAVFAVAAALIQWLLLRNAFLVAAKWLPVIFSAVGIFASEAAYAAGSFVSSLWLSWLSVPLYLGSAAVIFISYLNRR